MKVQYGRGYVYALEYHIVWCVKYRRKVLSAAVEQLLIQVLNDCATDCGFIIEECNTDLDHVHLLISATPHTSLPEIIRIMKGRSAKYILESYPDVKRKLWGGHLWNPSYFIATVSENTESQIRKYIRNQKE